MILKRFVPFTNALLACMASVLATAQGLVNLFYR